MSGTAAFRSAARRALRPPTTTSRSTLVAGNNEQPFSRRHYSAGGGNMEEGLNTRPAKRALPKEILDFIKRKQDEQAARQGFLTVEEVGRVFETRNRLMRHLLQEKFKYDRLKRVLVRIPIFAGIAFWVKTKYFSDGGEEATNNMTERD